MKVKNFFHFCLIGLIFFFVLAKSAQAAFLEFDPDSETAAVSEPFILDVIIDSGNNQILATDVRVIYDPTLLSVVDISDGDYFKVAKKDSSEEGKIYIAAIVENPAESKTGTGVVASITFKGLKNGSGNVTFVCTPGETATDSNIAKDDIDATDIIECSANGKAEIVIGTGSSLPQPTTVITPPTRLPESGMLEDLLAVAIPGFTLVFLGLGMKILLRRM